MKVGALLPQWLPLQQLLILGDPRPSAAVFFFSSWFPQMATELCAQGQG